MADAAKVEQIRDLAKEVRAIPVDALVTNPTKWGPFTFEEARADLDLIFSLAGHLETLPIEILPDNVAEPIRAALENCRNQVQRIQTFDLVSSQGAPREQQSRICAETKSAAQALLIHTQGWIPFLAYQKGDVQRNVDSLARAVSDATLILNQARTKAADTEDQIKTIIRAAREASAGAGVGVFTQDFSQEAQDLGKLAEKWLQATGVLGGVTLLVAVISAFIPLPANATMAHIWQFMTSKIVLLIVLVSATVWCGRIYKATMHQASVNKHRANSLRTFQAFVQASSDDTTRDAVLLETTRSIFSAASSGYLDGGEPAFDSGTKVLEIFKSGSKAAGTT